MDKTITTLLNDYADAVYRVGRYDAMLERGWDADVRREYVRKQHEAIADRIAARTALDDELKQRWMRG